VRLLEVIHRYGIEPIASYEVPTLAAGWLQLRLAASMTTLEAITRFIVPTELADETDKQLRDAGIER